MLLVLVTEPHRIGLGEEAGIVDPSWGHYATPNKLGH